MMATPLTTTSVAVAGDSSSSAVGVVASSDSKSPILIFLFFHKAIRSELDALHRSALAFASGETTDIQPLFQPYHLLRSIYKHHSNAEDEVIFTWMKGNNNANISEIATDYTQPQYCILTHQTENVKCAVKTENDTDVSGTHPINDILHWHNAIKTELSEIAEEARKIQLSGNFTNLSAYNERLQCIAQVCIFHSIAEDKVIFPTERT